MDRFVRIRLVILLPSLLCAALVWIVQLTAKVEVSHDFLVVRFLDVGQGDAVHIVTPDGYEMLVDGGATAGVLRELAQGQSFFDREIDVLVATHPDTDHIGGLVDVLGRYDVDIIIETEAQSESPAALAYAKAAALEGAEIKIAQAGQKIKLGASTTIEIYSPQGDTTNWENNSASVVFKLSYGEIDFMLTGDAPSQIEDYLVGAYGADLESEVLKLGHHGSKTSTSEKFLDTVRPEYVVVSASSDNRYGHPHYSVMDRVFERNIKSYSTATDGTITFETDGREVWVEK